MGSSRWAGGGSELAEVSYSHLGSPRSRMGGAMAPAASHRGTLGVSEPAQATESTHGLGAAGKIRDKRRRRCPDGGRRKKRRNARTRRRFPAVERGGPGGGSGDPGPDLPAAVARAARPGGRGRGGRAGATGREGGGAGAGLGVNFGGRRRSQPADGKSRGGGPSDDLNQHFPAF